MANMFTERTTISWGSKIRESFGSVLIGGFLFLAAFPLLFLNEGCHVKEMKALAQGESEVIPVDPDTVDPANEGKLVHMIGEVETDAELRDPDFGVSWNAIKLERAVEMYQWEESQETREVKRAGGSTERESTYTYKENWSPRLMDSSKFKHPAEHENPVQMRFQSETWAASDVFLGAFMLSGSLIDAIDELTEVALGEPERAAIPADLASETTLSGGEFYVGWDPASPEIGDLRISYRKVSAPQTVSLYSAQRGNSFVPYVAQNGRTLERLQLGAHSAQEMFAVAKQTSKFITWLVRFGGFLVMAIGLSLVFKPLVAMADVLPFLGNLIGGGVSLFAGVVAFGLSFITISVAWIFYRPLIGIPFLLIGVGTMAAFVVMKKKSKAA